MKPTLHITNWSSRRLYGQGRPYTIMAKPRHWEHGDGRVSLLVPHPLQQVRQVVRSWEEYWGAYTEALGRFQDYLGPGLLVAHTRIDDLEPGARDNRILIRDGDTLCCVCSKADAARGRCHRVWAARRLVAAGWAVILDGVPLALPDADDASSGAAAAIPAAGPEGGPDGS